MKKLNRKGFTLVELLAVIIILAIVVGITIPAVLTTTNKSKVRAGKIAAQSTADWVNRQYQTIATGLVGSDLSETTLDPAFTSNCGLDGSSCTGDPKTVNQSFIIAAGLSTSNVTSMTVKINSTTGRTCVELTVPKTSDYYFVNAKKCSDAGEDIKNCYQSVDADKAVIIAGNC